jgi:hypothetical protein
VKEWWVVYYLDTNALVSLRGHLSALRGTCFTSVLTLLEILKNTTAKNFERKREFVVPLLESQLPIDWATPNERVSLGFDVIKLRKQFKDQFRPMVEQFKYASSYDDFIQTVDHGVFSFDDINATLQILVESLKSTLVSMQNACEPKLSIDQIRKLAVEQGYDGLAKTLEKRNAEHIYEAVKFHAELVSKHLPEDAGEFTIPLLLTNYNGSLDRYFCAFAFYMRKRILFKESPKDNDLIDIQHLVYLRNRTCKIVTDDKMILDVCRSLFPRACTGVEDFKSRFLQ